MSKSVTIPSFNDPFVVEVNNTKYSYPAGTTQTVPDEVAAVIDNINANLPKEAPEKGEQGQVWTKQKKGADWDNLPIELPATGTTGHFLKKTATGCEWAAIEQDKKLYSHSIYVSFEDNSIGNCDCYFHLVTSSQTALTVATLKSWIGTNGAGSGTAKSYPVSGICGSGYLAQIATVSGDSFAITFGISSASVPSDATISDNVTEI